MSKSLVIDKLSATSLKEVLWETLNEIKSDKMLPAQGDAIASQRSSKIRRVSSSNSDCSPFCITTARYHPAFVSYEFLRLLLLLSVCLNQLNSLLNRRRDHNAGICRGDLHKSADHTNELLCPYVRERREQVRRDNRTTGKAGIVEPVKQN